MKGSYVSFRKTAARTVRITDSGASFVVVGVALLDIGQLVGIHGINSIRTIFNQDCLVNCLANDELLADEVIVNLRRS